MQRYFRLRPFVGALPVALLLLTACTLPPMPKMPEMPDLSGIDLPRVDLSSMAGLLPGVEAADDGGFNVRIQSVPLRIALAASSAALTVAADAYLGMEVDPVDLLDKVAGVNVVDIPRLAVSGAAVDAPAGAWAAANRRDPAQVAALDPAAWVPAQTGLPPTDLPVLMVISKQNNETLFWQLSDDVQSVRLRAEDAGGVEMKVHNGTPLRIELWVDESIEAIDVVVEYAE